MFESGYGNSPRKKGENTTKRKLLTPTRIKIIEMKLHKNLKTPKNVHVINGHHVFSNKKISKGGSVFFTLYYNITKVKCVLNISVLYLPTGVCCRREQMQRLVFRARARLFFLVTLDLLNKLGNSFPTTYQCYVKKLESLSAIAWRDSYASFVLSKLPRVSI